MLRSISATAWGTRHYYRELHGPQGTPEFVLTRVCSDPGPLLKMPAMPTDDAILVWVALTPPTIGQWRARYDGRDIGVTRPAAFATTVLSLNRPMELWLRGPFDFFHYYLAASCLQRIACEHEVSMTGGLREAFFADDLLVAQLTKSILSLSSHGTRFGQLALGQVAQVLGSHVLQRYCGAVRAANSARHGLQPWQAARAADLLASGLDSGITIADIATACSLSVRQFTRAFRGSFGVSPHQYLIQLRLERAKTLLAKTTKSLAEIAQVCGFCDQPAFTRAFSRTERMPPSLWRKVNC